MESHIYDLCVNSFILLLHPRCNQNSPIAQYLTTDLTINLIKKITSYFRHTLIYHTNGNIDFIISDFKICVSYNKKLIFEICDTDKILNVIFGVTARKRQIYFVVRNDEPLLILWNKNMTTQEINGFTKKIYKELSADALSNTIIDSNDSMKNIGKIYYSFYHVCKHLIYTINTCLNDKVIQHKRLEDIKSIIVVNSVLGYTEKKYTFVC